MGFEIVDPGAPRVRWMHVDTGVTLYHGQLVQAVDGEGAKPLAVAAGAVDTTGKNVIQGVVVGDNNATPLWSNTYNANYITAVTSQADQVAADRLGVEGKHPKGEKAAMVKVAEITPATVLRAPIFGSATVHGTALTEVVVSTGSTTGLGFTSDATQFTPVADHATSYCKSGANAGIYRISDDTSTTVETNDLAFPYDIAIGDTFVRAPVRMNGHARVNINTTAGIGLWIDGTAALTTHWYLIDVLDLDLSDPAKASVTFRFVSTHFDPVRT